MIGCSCWQDTLPSPVWWDRCWGFRDKPRHHLWLFGGQGVESWPLERPWWLFVYPHTHLRQLGHKLHSTHQLLYTALQMYVHRTPQHICTQ